MCDTSFLFHVASARIKNAGSLDAEIGSISFLVPGAVMRELEGLARDPRKAAAAEAAARYAGRLGRIGLPQGGDADDSIVRHVAGSGGAPLVATMDAALKRRVKEAGGSVVSVAGDRIVLEEGGGASPRGPRRGARARAGPGRGPRRR